MKDDEKQFRAALDAELSRSPNRGGDDESPLLSAELERLAGIERQARTRLRAIGDSRRDAPQRAYIDEERRCLLLVVGYAEHVRECVRLGNIAAAREWALRVFRLSDDALLAQLLRLRKQRVPDDEILRVIDECGGNRSEAARKLGLDPRSV